MLGLVSEKAMTGAFVLLVVTVLLAYVVEIVHAVRLRLGRPYAPQTRRRRWWRRGVLLFGTFGTACIVYGLVARWPVCPCVNPTKSLRSNSK